MKAAALCLALGLVRAAGQQAVPLFNGTDLTGWVNVNCAPETWSATNGMIHCTGFPTGALRTARQYENYVLELEWRHLQAGGNSGVFIWGSPLGAPGVPFLRAVEVQVLDHGYNAKGKNEWYTTHGDVFPIHGSTMAPFGRHNGMRSFPSEERSNGSPQWNHYRVVCTNGVIHLSVNGKVVSGGEHCNYRKGYVGLESEGAPIDFRNLTITELPPGDAPAAETAPLDQGWASLFTGLDLRGWTSGSAAAGRCGVRDEQIWLEAASAGSGATLWTEHEFGDAEFILDCRPAQPQGASSRPPTEVRLRGLILPLPSAATGEYQRYVIRCRGREVAMEWAGGGRVILEAPPTAPVRGPFGLQQRGGKAEFRNLYVRSL